MFNDPQEMHLDSLYFERQLEVMLPEILEERTIPLNAERLFPMIPVPDPDAERFVKRAFDWEGGAVRGRIGGEYKDVPIVNGQITEQVERLWRYKHGWRMDDRTLRNARARGIALDNFYARAAVWELFKKENDVLFNGDTTYGTNGLFTAGLIGTTALGSGVAWDNAGVTATDIYDDLEQMVRFIEEGTSTAYNEPVTIVLPNKAWNIANGFNMGLGTDTTVLQYFLRNWGQMVASVEKAIEFDTQKEALVMIRNPMFMGHMRVPVRQIGPARPTPLDEFQITHYEIANSGMVVYDSNTQRRFTGILT